jgi:hypothetical protein
MGSSILTRNSWVAPILFMTASSARKGGESVRPRTLDPRTESTDLTSTGPISKEFDMVEEEEEEEREGGWEMGGFYMRSSTTNSRRLNNLSL